ncbi:hypothetical protein C461_14408 [Halorubrum aidingense JCM 13560]|uniref:Uncharacterized protein n=1 Tax=Halorubrum aidingense JCM 13560 TaxID=1230454 RepID=M0P5D9_9EURY|nr:hypothetical protein C461_14408 [Halorubrum aidingense JCM 13560]
MLFRTGAPGSRAEVSGVVADAQQPIGVLVDDRGAFSPARPGRAPQSQGAIAVVFAGIDDSAPLPESLSKFDGRTPSIVAAVGARASFERALSGTPIDLDGRG